MRTPTLLLLALCSACLAQPARIDGRVVKSDGSPLSKATVTLLGNTPAANAVQPRSYGAVSDGQGRFLIEGIEPGAYRLIAERAGYLPFFFRETGGLVAVEIEPASHRSFELQMTAQSFLTGHILDEDGEPFPNARITLFRSPAGANGQITPAGTATAGPEGSYALAGLVAGRYYLSAAPPPSLGQNPQAYVTTYFPSSLDLANAGAIDVPAETEIRFRDLRLRRARTFRILGKVVDPAGDLVTGATIGLSNHAVNNPFGARPQPASHGLFEFSGLLPGDYLLRAQSGTLLARQIVTITDHDLDDFAVTLAPPLEIPLSFRLDGASPDQAPDNPGRSTLTSTDGINDNAMIVRATDGTAAFRNIGPGTYRLATDIPTGTYIKRIRYGNRDITGKLLTTGDTAAPLEVLLSPHPAELAGTVRDEQGRPLAGITVTLWIPGPLAEDAVDPARSTTTGADGAFRFPALAPGDYRIAAWEKIDLSLARRTSFLQGFATHATPVTLTEDAHQQVQPPLISAE